MKRKKKILPSGLFELGALMAALFLLYSCEKEEETEILSNPETSVSFQYQLLNEDDETIYTFSSSTVFRRTSGWLADLDGDGGASWLKKEVFLSPSLENGREMSIYIMIQGEEADINLLELRDKEQHHWERDWDYKSTAKEIERFYNHEGIRILIEGTPLDPEYLKIERAQKVMVDGKEKTYVEIRFRGEAFGVYDYYKAHRGLCIKEGYFAGVIE